MSSRSIAEWLTYLLTLPNILSYNASKRPAVNRMWTLLHVSKFWSTPCAEMVTFRLMPNCATRCIPDYGSRDLKQWHSRLRSTCAKLAKQVPPRQLRRCTM
ncbi:unnamed protein product [Amoebophrya sp. A25]|nr:unnamed protein product [Amoebophrya sp. A25]|eukprot:GSA25T00018969001.1